jgi:cytochrome c-type biogenesis protein CcmF
MITDIGYISLLLALVVGIYGAVASVLGAKEGFPELVHSARRAVYAVAGLCTLAILTLAHALVTKDFGLRYAWQYVSSDMDLAYRIAAVYAGNSGSLLFWGWVLSLMAAAVVYVGRRDRVLTPYVATVTMVVTSFFFTLVVLTSNPFERMTTVAAEGRGMNPILENFGMLVHPPTLFLGYVGLTIPFAFAVAALLTGRLDGEWVRRTRSWALFAWLMLGIGNILGGLWAYEELGWGGYWVWDPVENASLMPWLIITAYLHAAVVLQRRSMFKVWAVSLAAMAFLLTIFGTFVTRSGIISSVHAFGQSSLAPFFIVFMGAIALFTIGLIAWRWNRLRGDDEIETFMSRENWMMITNIILVGITAAVMFGTIYPLISELATGRKMELGVDFYNQVNGPIMLGLLAVLGICPILAWRRSSKDNLVSSLWPPALTSLVVVIALFALGVGNVIAIAGFGICAFMISTHLFDWYRATRARQRALGGNPVVAFAGVFWGNRSRHGAHLSHLSIALIAIGVIGSNFFVSTAEANLRVGETLQVNAYTLRYEGLSRDSTPSRDIVTATVTLLSGETVLAQMTPETVFHRSYEQPVSEVAIRMTLREDVYVILAAWTADGAATFKVLVNPLVVWIWIGGVLMTLGGTLALWPEARRQREPAADEKRRRRAPTATEPA